MSCSTYTCSLQPADFSLLRGQQTPRWAPCLLWVVIYRPYESEFVTCWPVGGRHAPAGRRCVPRLQPFMYYTNVCTIADPHLPSWLQSAGSMILPWPFAPDIEDMAPDSGRTTQRHLRKVAVYNDENNVKHSFSALCPHLGCLLQVEMCFPCCRIDVVVRWSKGTFSHHRAWQASYLPRACRAVPNGCRELNVMTRAL